MPQYVLFNKPFHVLTQFTDKEQRSTLADYINIPDIYSAGRLDYDSEGLLVLTDDGALVHAMMNPSHKVTKTYLAQVEGLVSEHQLATLRQGVELKDGLTRPCQARVVEQPTWLWPRTPPIRERQSIPTSWIELSISEGKNRQVRRMTAHVGLPTLRLIRTAIAGLTLGELKPGEFQILDKQTIIDNGIKWAPKLPKTVQTRAKFRRQSVKKHKT